MDFFTSILDDNQKKVLPKLSFLTKQGFYLAGGTSLALQIGHRTSVDFDFFIPDHFDSKVLIEKINNTFEDKAKATVIEKDTVFVNICDVDCSFFWYKYPLIEDSKLLEGVNLAGLSDISAMKLISVSHRPAKRDYIDVYYLLKKFGLSKMIEFANKKYSNLNEYLVLRALTYYDDVEGKENKRAIQMLDKNFSWELVKKTITEEVDKYQLAMFKH